MESNSNQLTTLSPKTQECSNVKIVELYTGKIFKFSVPCFVNDMSMIVHVS